MWSSKWYKMRTLYTIIYKKCRSTVVLTNLRRDRDLAYSLEALKTQNGESQKFECGYS